MNGPEKPRVVVVGAGFGGLMLARALRKASVEVLLIDRQIRRRIVGQPTTTFRYTDKGIMATIGRNAAVAELAFGLRTSGFLAWVMWLMLHLVLLIGFRNRLNVLVNWAWNYFTYDRSARLIMHPPRATPHAEAGPFEQEPETLKTPHGAP